MKNRYKIISVALLLFVLSSCQMLRAQHNPDEGLQGVAIKTNLLYDGAMIPNIGVEFAFPNNWSLIGNWNYAWWSNYDRHRFWRTYGGEVEARKWFGKYAGQELFRGQHCGLYIMAGTYDFERGHTGYMNDLYFSVGVAYGYAVKIARNLSLDFVIGIGYMCGTYEKYKPEDGKYCIIDTKNLSYFGPTKAEISLVWNISDLFYGKKGGRK
ncbi:MAG: DUF3575 domain-containing protein [Bacteroidales bacterium]